jgi:serine/threonine protein kinase
MNQAAAQRRPILTVVPPPTPLDALPVGTRLQTYNILGLAGEGGFSIVYRAHDGELDREVAIKEYLPAVHAVRINGQVRARSAAKRGMFESGMRHFVTEAHTLAQLRHPALSEVLRFFEANGTAYMVMPHYRGRTLREMVRDGYRVKSAKELLGIVLPLLDGLMQLHAIPCTHLDISSDNILIQEDGAPVLLDFGAARRAQIDRGDPATIILKPGFAPIEQYSHDEESGLSTGPWSDIYALAAVMYQLISGNMPMISVARIMHDGLKPLSRFAVPGLPVEMLKIIEKGLAVQPHDRPANAGAFSEELKKAAGKQDGTYLFDRGRKSPPVDPFGEADTGNKEETPEEDRSARQAVAPRRVGVLLSSLLILVILSVVILSTLIPSGDGNVDGESGGKGRETDELTTLQLSSEENKALTTNVSSGDGVTVTQQPPAEEPPLPTTGRLEVRVKPWGFVYLDGKLIGTAPPAVVTETPAGIHLIEVHNESHQPYRQGLDIRRGQHVRITHDFTASAEAAPTQPGQRTILP